MSDIKTGFDYAIISAKKAAQRGDIAGLGRQLSAAHALALWGDPKLLDRYQALETECWQEYEKCKTTTRVAA